MAATAPTTTPTIRPVLAPPFLLPPPVAGGDAAGARSKPRPSVEGATADDTGALLTSGAEPGAEEDGTTAGADAGMVALPPPALTMVVVADVTDRPVARDTPPSHCQHADREGSFVTGCQGQGEVTVPSQTRLHR